MNMEESSEGKDEKHVATSMDDKSVTSATSGKNSLPSDDSNVIAHILNPYENPQDGSYWDMPGSIFKTDYNSFCQYLYNLFPENYEFEENRTVQLMAAEENRTVQFLPDSGTSSRFRVLIVYKVLQESSIPNCSSDQPRYKLNHSLYRAKYIHKDSSTSSQIHCRIEVDNYDASATALSQTTLHASLVLSSSHHVSANSIFNIFLHHSPNLETLLLLGQHKSLVDQVPRALFLKLRNLTVLDLSYTSITELPSSFANLKFLRFLDVSGTPITRLPDSICGFQDMQTLILKDCLELLGLPKELRRLRNLRYLEFDTTTSSQITSMPPGIGSLTHLLTLSAFIVGKEEDGSGIAELKGMKNLGETLRILKLENVSNSDEAKKAALNQKHYLRTLELEWTNNSSSQNGLQVLKSLEPSVGITALRIIGYKGPNFPTWFGDPSFFTLRTITLYDCTCDSYYPSSLGRLPILETLHIGEMREVKIINQHRDRKGAFPMLKSLVLHSLPDLEEWVGVKEGDFHSLRYLKVSCCPELTNFPNLRFFTSLQQLEISSCSRLQSLSPPAPSLKFLLIIDCPMLKERYKKESVDWHQISHITDVWIDYNRMDN